MRSLKIAIVLLAFIVAASPLIPVRTANAASTVQCRAMQGAIAQVGAPPSTLPMASLGFWWWPPDWFTLPPPPPYTNYIVEMWTETKCRAPVLFCQDNSQYSDGTITTHEYPCGVCFDIFGWF